MRAIAAFLGIGVLLSQGCVTTGAKPDQPAFNGPPKSEPTNWRLSVNLSYMPSGAQTCCALNWDEPGQLRIWRKQPGAAQTAFETNIPPQTASELYDLAANLVRNFQYGTTPPGTNAAESVDIHLMFLVGDRGMGCHYLHMPPFTIEATPRPGDEPVPIELKRLTDRINSLVPANRKI